MSAGNLAAPVYVPRSHSSPRHGLSSGSQCATYFLAQSLLLPRCRITVRHHGISIKRTRHRSSPRQDLPKPDGHRLLDWRGCQRGHLGIALVAAAEKLGCRPEVHTGLEHRDGPLDRVASLPHWQSDREANLAAISLLGVYHPAGRYTTSSWSRRPRSEHLPWERYLQTSRVSSGQFDEPMLSSND